MKKEFKSWLINVKGLKSSTAHSRSSNILTIEACYGDIDEIMAAGKVGSILSELVYSRKDERNKLPQKHRIPIDGNIYNGSSTLRQALNRYIEFYNTSYGVSDESELKKVYDELRKSTGDFRHSICDESDLLNNVKLIQQSLLKWLKLTMPSIKWSEEYILNAKCRDRADIFGVIDDNSIVIIELDTERADQICKKFISRQALTLNYNSVYVAVTYRNNHANTKAERKETSKYLKYIKRLTEAISKNSPFDKLFHHVEL